MGMTRSAAMTALPMIAARMPRMSEVRRLSEIAAGDVISKPSRFEKADSKRAQGNDASDVALVLYDVNAEAAAKRGAVAEGLPTRETCAEDLAQFLGG
jgi:hypothetical protein